MDGAACPCRRGTRFAWKLYVSTRILVVDDEQAYTRLIRLILSRNCGYEVMEENDSTKALDTAIAFQPDLILLDIVMPGLDGGEVARRMRQSPQLANVPIVFVSGIGLTDTSTHGISSNLTGFPFQAKPFQMEKLLDCISHHLKPPSPAMG